MAQTRSFTTIGPSFGMPSLLLITYTCCLDLFQHSSPFSKPVSTLGVFALGALLSGLDCERRYINLEIRLSVFRFVELYGNQVVQFVKISFKIF